MTSTGMKFFIDLVDIEYDQVLAAFSFYSGFASNNIVYPEKWSGSNSATGYLNTIDSNFYSSGTGRFNGSLIMFLSGQNFNTNNFTSLISYEKLRSGNEILLSSATGNNFNDSVGYSLGVNDANKLYFEYWNPVEGIFTFTYKNILSNKNLILFNKNDSTINLGRYNNNTFSFEIEDFSIYQSEFKHNPSGSLYLGGSPSNNWSNNNSLNFSGYIDKFFFFNNIPLLYSNILASGLFSVATGYEGYNETICYTTGYNINSGFSYTGTTGTFISGFTSGLSGITGYSTGISGYSYSGITGYIKSSLGVYIDNCGNSNEIYEEIAVSGLISGNYITIQALTGIQYITGAKEIYLTGTLSGYSGVYVTGEICNNIFIVSGDVLYDIDNNYLSSLSYREISLLSKIDAGKDLIEYYYEPYKKENLQYNNDLTFNNLNNNFFDSKNTLDDKNILLFAQGQALSTSGGEQVKDGYDTIQKAYLDYFINDNSVELNKNYDNSYELFYDYYKNREGYSVSEVSGYKSGDSVLFGLNAPETGLIDAFVFQNGQKLLSGIDYEVEPLIAVGGTFTGYLLPSTVTSRFVVLNNNTGSINMTGNFNTNVRSILLDNNKFLIGGGFTLVNGVPQSGLARLFAKDNTLDTTFNAQVNGNLSVLSIVKHNNKYIVGGTFTAINGIVQNRIARLNLDGSVDTSFIPNGSGFNDSVYSILTDYQDNIYVGGLFTSYNSIPISRIVKLNKDGVLDTNFNSGNNINNYVYDICPTSDNNIIIGGGFTDINGSGFGRIARMDLNGNIISNIRSGFNDIVYNIVEDQNKNILICGNFTGFSGNNIRAERFIVLDKNENISPLYNPNSGFSASVQKIVIQNDNKILLGGNFTTYKGSGYNRIIRLNSDYSIDTSFLQTGQGFNSTVYVILSYDAIKLKISGSGGNDIFMAKEYPLNFENISGNNSSFSIPKNYNNESSLVFLNGVRQKLNNNYIENSNFDLLSSGYDEPSTNSIIYNNTDDFFV